MQGPPFEDESGTLAAHRVQLLQIFNCGSVDQSQELLIWKDSSSTHSLTVRNWPKRVRAQ